MMSRFVIPLAIFVGLAILLAVGLDRDPRRVPSPLIDKPAPAFSLPTLSDGSRLVGPSDFAGKVWLLNVWASWCVACREEHPVLNQLAQRNLLPMVGLNYKDEPQAAKAWLRDRGNPYSTVAVDANGRVGIDWGVYGVPETFVVDKTGIIRHKHIGPINADVLRNELLPLIQRLQQEPA